jgi:3-hydroxyacyl-CoA dehydrogenase
MDIRTIRIVGAGTNGGGITINVAQHGVAVRLSATSPAAVEWAIAPALGTCGLTAPRALARAGSLLG